eukprot:CAMPEP_0184981204 /NCGR_PEP_ID=MMETSP1098-20130426/11028_1 /TAXON_ID=89044 /ORGANISM="Spumella elongata, Strain CCAP 955/1" /LENGTH=628 /DNA_ID=CAMNT_0027504749 /DNA_START=246 /DNA_END=2132 /DNA_ORIENTATION=-
MLNAELSVADRECLEEFVRVRQGLAADLGLSSREHDSMISYQSNEVEELSTHELLIAEADAVMALGDEQFAEGMKFEAMLNYHTACVFYRVMETMIPSKTSSNQHSKLVYVAHRTRQASTIYQNFVRENFTGGSCSDMYEVHGTSKLGKGSYGSVYLATHRITGDERAVKVMNVDRITSYYLRKLHTEIAILKSLDHPNIIKLQDVFFGKRSVYIVTDLCRGGELFELLNSGKNQGFVFREDRASKLMRDMLSAVNYLHENGIVHRDLKLENFLFEDHNSNSPLILIDFGLSKHVSPGERLTQKVGSCYYTAPEVLNGNYDYKCDVWSLGVLCYMLLSGSPPFFGKTVDDVYLSIQTKEATFTDKKFKHVSNSCLDFMKRLLVRDVRYRMSTGDALNHPFITGAPFYPRYASMQAADFDVVSPEEEKNGEGGALVRNTDKLAGILQSLKVFAEADPLTKMTMEMVSHTLGSLQVQQFREEFQTIDTSHLGRISHRDFVRTFSNCDPHLLGKWDLKDLFESVSLERAHGHNQNMSYHEYVAAVMHDRVDIKSSRLDLVFSFLDPDNTGVISAESIRSALGEDLSEEELRAMILAGDLDGDSLVSKKELTQLWQTVYGEAGPAGKQQYHK